MKTPSYPRIILPSLFVGLSALSFWQFRPEPSAVSLRDALKEGQGAELESTDAGGLLREAKGAGAGIPDVAGKAQGEVEARLLARATAEEAAEEAAQDILKRLDKALALHPDVKMITRENAYELSKGEGGNGNYDFEETIKLFLEWLGQGRAAVETVRSKAKPWALELLGRSVKDGYVVYNFEKIPSGLLLRSLERVEERNALRAFKAPQGINLKKLIEQWGTVQEDASLDTDVFYPVLFSAQPSLTDIRRAFPIGKVGLVSTKWKAIDDFAGSDEGPAGDEGFKPIGDALKGPGIRQRFYFRGEAEDWSSNVLLVVDEHNQAWGFQMGYSQ